MSTSMAPSEPHVGLIIREREPVNLEYPFDQLNEFLTPNDLFYIRSHYKAPVLDRRDYKLTIGGAVDKPFTISYEELLAMPSVTRPATLECAGNGRIFLVPQVKGAQWQLGGISTAEWTGVPLSALLERAGLDANACEVLFEAADKGTPKEEPVPPGETPYARSVSVEKIDDIVIAYAMNGEEIPVDHGFPLRVVVPGHYGMASVKWLTNIRVLTEPYKGYWQTSDYGYWAYDENRNPMRLALGQMQVKSAIARPRTREFIPAGSTYNVYGAAWGGEPYIETVELSTDDGKSWQPVRFLDEPQYGAWRRWEFVWQVPADKGTYVLKSRATDPKGTTQPAVTQQIKSLEEDLGSPLFDRGGGRISLTAAGKALLPFADQMKTLGEQAYAAVAAANGQQAGELAVGASQTIAQYLLPNLIANFLKA